MIHRQSLLAALLLLAIYVAGGISALALERVVRRDDSRFSRSFPRPGPGGDFRPTTGPGPGDQEGFYANVLARRLDLSTEQEEQIRAVIQEKRKQMDEVMQNLRPEIEARFQEMDAQIRALLTPEQEQAFEEFVDEGFARMGGFRPMGPPSGRPRPPVPR